MEPNNILTSDVLDIIFDGRNKQYGAYELRKTYNKRLKTAMAVMLFTCLLAMVGGVLASNGGGKHSMAPLLVKDYTLTAVNDNPPKPIVIPPPEKKLVPIQIKKFTPPLLVKDVVTPPPAQDALDDTKIGAIDQAGIKTDVVAPPVEAKGTGTVTAPVVADDYSKEVFRVEVQAQFPGGMGAWIKYLERSLRQDVPVENGAPAGDYKVVVSFLVDRDGNISEVKAENDPGYGIAAEAIRVIQKSGKWIPALQNGNHVIYRQKQPITFRVSDNQ
jgi:protein TonB